MPVSPMGVLTYFWAGGEIGVTAYDFGWVEFGGPW